jgi:formate/nitrite transporter FocA (FNT family)
MANETVYFPWSWTITSENQSVHTCPSVSKILSTFAVVNAAVCFVSIIFGNRYVVKFGEARIVGGEKLRNNTNKTIVTCGALGKVNTSSWKFMWILTVGLNLIANAIVAAIIKHSPGYLATFKVWELMLFLLARPRLSWIILGFFAGRQVKEVQVPMDTKKILKGQQSYERLNVVEEMDIYGNSTSTLVSKEVDRPWMNAFLTGFIAEVLMQLAALYMVRTVECPKLLHSWLEISSFMHTKSSC